MSIERATAPRWLDEDEEGAWRAYRRMRALLDLEISRDLATDSGLSDADYDVLSNLSESPDERCRLKALAERMLWTESRLSHHITRMEARGLVRRQRATGDGRGTVVALTDEGRRVLIDAAPGHVASVRRAFIDLMTPEQVTGLRTLAETVIAHLTHTTDPPRDTGSR